MAKKQRKTRSLDSHSSRKNPASVSLVDDSTYGSNVASANINIRMGFMRKVYGILTSQLIVTILVAALFMTSEAIQEYVQQNHWMVIVSMFGSFASLIALMWIRHETPTNYVLLGIFTLLESYAIGVIVTFYQIPSVIEAFLLTAGLFVGLTMYTLQSKKDFSSWYAPAVMCLWTLFIVQLIQLFFPVPALHMIISLGGALLFCVFVVVDTHMNMATLSPEEYIMAAINLYLDILNLFIFILRIIGKEK